MNRRGFIRLVTVGGALLWARTAPAGPVTTDSIGDQVQTLPRGRFPDFAPASRGIQDLYRFAVEHGDDLAYIPCTCGCGRFGHRSNRECYIKAVNPNGTITFTSHAAT